MGDNTSTRLRLPTLNEARCIIRQDLGYYRGLAVGATYQIPDNPVESSEAVARLFGSALQACVSQHAILGVVIDRPGTDHPSYRRLAHLDLRNHLFVKPSSQGVSDQGHESGSDGSSLASLLESIVNVNFSAVDQIPPWRVWICPLGCKAQMSSYRVVFHYSHSVGDGKSGIAFHQSFSRALMTDRGGENDKIPLELHTGTTELPPAMEPLPISWSYLLSAVIKEYLPPRLRLLSRIPPIETSAWTGSSMTFVPSTFESCLQEVRLQARDLDNVLQQCRKAQIKLTGLLNVLLARSLSRELKSVGMEHEALISSTAISLRHLYGVKASEMGLYASTVTHCHTCNGLGQAFSEDEIACARQLTDKLSKLSNTATDQPVGLLSYATSVKQWLQGKHGKSRDTSFEVSNLMSFDCEVNSPVHQALHLKVTDIYFAQPADAVGHPISFNVVSLRDGDLVIMCCWQAGALGLVQKDSLATAHDVQAKTERAFMKAVARHLSDELQAWAFCEGKN
jgi:hypothetical protein